MVMSGVARFAPGARPGGSGDGGVRVRPLTRAGATGAVAALLGVLLIATPVGLALEERFGLGWLFWTRGPAAPPADVAVVSLDRRSTEELGLPEKIRNWPRTVLARLIDRLVELQASVVVFDLILDQPREPEDDGALAASIAAARRVVLFEYLDRTVRPIDDDSGAVAGVISREQLRPPLAAFVAAAAGVGPFPLPKVPARVSQFWAFGANLDDRPSLPIVALQRRALDAYPEWLELLRAAGMAGVESLPVVDGGFDGAVRLHDLMVRVRAAFLADPDLAARAAAQLRAAPRSPADQRQLQALLEVYGGPDSHYLNFYGPAGSVPTVPLYEVLEGGEAAAKLAGRVVFVGLSDLNNPHEDDFPTVFSRADGVDVAGVEIAATALANLLEDRLLEPAGRWTGVALVGLFGLAIGLIAGRLPAPVAIPSALLLAGMYYGGAGLAFARHALWLPVAVPLMLQLPLGLFMGLFLQYRAAQRAKANIDRGMHYYLPDKVARGFAEAAIDPTAVKERVYAVCMVTDASRFTTMAEAMAPEDLSSFLDDYFAILFGVVERHGGLVTDVIGDGTTSVWTAAAPERASRLRACLAALEIERAVAGFNRQNPARELPTRFGLNAGYAVVGNVGGSGRFAYSVIGDCVNTAARLESLNKQLGTRLLANAELTADLDELRRRPLGRFQLKGKHDVVALDEILGHAEIDAVDRGPLDRFAAGLERFEVADWAAAAARFTAVLAERPDDGPSRFYLDLCRRHLAGGPPPETPGVVRLEQK